MHEALDRLLSELRTRCTRSATLRWGHLEFEYRSESADRLDWTTAHLSVDGTGSRSAARAKYEVFDLVDRTLLERLRAEFLGWPSTPVVSYEPGGRHDQVTVDGGRFFLSASPTSPRHILAISGSTIGIVADDVSGSERVAARIMREAIRERHGDEGVPLHASAARFGIAGGAIVFAGTSGSGKTTAACYAARQGELLSGDRTFLMRSGQSSWEAIGYPSALRIGAGTARVLGLERSSFLRHSLNPLVKGKHELALAELREHLGIATSDAAPLAALVVVDSMPPFGIERLSPSRGAEAIRPHVLVPDPEWPEPWLFGRPRDASVDEVLVSLLGGVPLYHLGWFPQRHDQDSFLRELRKLPELRA